ncbi:Alpha/Beta hydrolase protein [Obelidium mucronatum]|nr:Alpha/Beta hydrolase protein [Obelidium mucronatum]
MTPPRLLSHLIHSSHNSVLSPLFVLHGFLGSKSNWRPIAKQLAGRTKRDIVCIDLRNHGDSFHDPVHTHDSMAADVFVLADHLGIQKFSLMGHSQGGKTSMHMALTNGERIDKFIVVDTTPGTYNLVEFEGYLESMKEVSAAKVSTLDDANEIFVKRNVSDPLIRRFLLSNLKQVPGSPRFDFRINLTALQAAVTNPDMYVSTSGFPFHQENVTFDREALFIRGTLSDYVRGEKERLGFVGQQQKMIQRIVESDESSSEDGGVLELWDKKTLMTPGKKQ